MSGDAFELKSESALDFWRATTADLPTVMEILVEAAAWLQDKGINQWPSPPNEHWQRRMRAAVERGQVYTVGIGKNRFGIVRVTWSDPYWPDDGRAGYVHTMAIRNSMHGQNLGAAILFWAAQKAQREGKRFLRLDCLASNGRLRRYYEEQAFSYRGEVTDRDYVAALYELVLGKGKT